MLLVQNGKRLPFVQAASGSFTSTEGSSLPKEFAIRKIPKFPDNPELEEPPEILSGDEDEHDHEQREDVDDELDRGSNASSLSDNVVIPGLKEIVFSDEPEGTPIEDDDDEEDQDENLKIMAMLVKQENDRLEKQISRMTSYVESMEDKQLQEQCRQEIELECGPSTNHDGTSLVDITSEDERKKRARERYEKRRRQRLKEKEESRQRRRTQQEEKRRKKKQMAMKRKFAKRQQQRLKKRNEQRSKRRKELEAYQAAPEERPTKGQIVHLFDKYFYKPFEVVQVRYLQCCYLGAMLSLHWIFKLVLYGFY